MIANGFEEAASQYGRAKRRYRSFNPCKSPGDYLRRSAITGQMETVTEYGNGVQSVSPVGH